MHLQTDQQTKQTDEPTDQPSQKDAQPHLKNKNWADGRPMPFSRWTVSLSLSQICCLFPLCISLSARSRSRVSTVFPHMVPICSLFSPLVLLVDDHQFCFRFERVDRKGLSPKNMSIKQTRIRLKIRLLFSAAGLLDSLLSLIFEFSPPTFPSPFSTLSTLSSTITSIVRVG